MNVPLEWLKEYVTIRLAPKALGERLTMAGLEVVAIQDPDGEPVLDLEVTPNRADCLSIIGLAREVAAITGQRLKPAQGSRFKAQGTRARGSRLEARAPVTIRIEDHKGCRRYIGRLIEGVTIGPSPAWMQRRLAACGARPINNIVDITNYVLFECGQPLHAFDLSKLSKGTIIVRRAAAGEPITTLDVVDRTLSAETLVIADGERPVAVAGVMGGMGSEVTAETRDVLLESALFDPITVRRTARQLGLASESSYRFERGVDPGGVEMASARAAALMADLGGGVESHMVDVGKTTPKRTTILLEPQRLSRWLGVSISPTAARTALARLSCRVASSGSAQTLRVEVPSFRQDLKQEVDLFEELARMIGYDKIPGTLPSTQLGRRREDDQGAADHQRLQSLRWACAGLGLTEVITWSLLSAQELSRCRLPVERAIRLVNPLSQDHSILRPSLVPGLLQAVRRNATQGAPAIRLFEVGAVFMPGDGPTGRMVEQSHGGGRSACLPLAGAGRDVALVGTDVQMPQALCVGLQERTQLGIALSGMWTDDWRLHARADFFHVKGLVTTLVGRLCRGSIGAAHSAVPWAEPGLGVTLALDGRVIGVAGQVARQVAEAFDVGQDVFVAELEIPALLAARRGLPQVVAPTTFPPVKRDLSVLVASDTPFETVDQALREIGGPMVGAIRLIDRYTGPQIPSGKTSLTFSIEYRDPSRTLTATEADAIHQQMGQQLMSRFGAALR